MISKAHLFPAIVVVCSLGMLAPGIAPAESPHQEITIEKGRLVVDSGNEPEEIENLVEYCLACHEGSGESPVTSGSAPAARHELGSVDRNHPVDVQYPDGRTGYRPADALDTRLVLIEGRMTCLTCHASTVDRALVLPRERSALCTACHAK